MFGMPIFAASYVMLALTEGVGSPRSRLVDFASEMQHPETLFAVSAVTVLLGFVVGIVGILARPLRRINPFRDLNQPGDQYRSNKSEQI